MLVYGVMFLEGRAVTRDVPAAYKWLLLADKFGAADPAVPLPLPLSLSLARSRARARSLSRALALALALARSLSLALALALALALSLFLSLSLSLARSLSLSISLFPLLPPCRAHRREHSESQSERAVRETGA